MNSGEFEATIGDLRRIVSFFERARPGEYEVGVVERGDRFLVYWAVDRTSLRYQQTFDDESEALTKLLAPARLEDTRQRLFRDHPRPGARALA
jgi:hypothetical protein